MLRKIKVMTKTGEMRRVWAWCVGNLAIHKTIFDDGQIYNVWTITHIPTRCAVSRDSAFLWRIEIPGKLAWAQSLEVAGVKVIDMPACEVVNVCSLFQRDEEAMTEWEERRPIVVKALGCE